MKKPMNAIPTEPLVICDGSLSRAWARLLLTVLDRAGTEVSPVFICLSGFGAMGEVTEDSEVREALDHLLAAKSRYSVENVAFTIFPQQLWRISRNNRQRLFELYRRTFPRWRAMNKRGNGRGLYFERLTMYGRGPCDGNQLEWILGQFEKGGVRRSMLQASPFDPGRDHTGAAQLGFPCLQQVSFVPTSNGLEVNAFYATQQIFDKAYGNYLGLAQLGAFMAHEMKLRLSRLNVYIGIAKLERITKRDLDLAPLIAAARVLVGDSDYASGAAQKSVESIGATS